MNPCEGICSSNAKYNLSFFIHHFQATLDNQFVFFDFVDTFFLLTHIKKIDMEKSLGYTMLNVVVCHGLNGVEQLKTYWEHDSCTKHARFT